MAMEEPPQLFLCPISMELMEDPVTVSTGVTYDRRSIERWFFRYGKTTCPATMQRLNSFDLTPNHTLKRVISTWLDGGASSSSSSSPSSPGTPLRNKLARENLPSVLAGIEATPFKVTALKNLRRCMDEDEAAQQDFVAHGGIQVLGRVMTQALAESCAGGDDFSAFRTCEEAGAVLAALPLRDAASVDLVLAPECIKPVVAVVQRGSAESRLHAMAILAKIGADRDWTAGVDDVDDLVKSILELLSDGGASAKLSSRALDVLLDVTASSRSRGARGRAKAVEVGAVRVLVELLPADADRRVAERALLLLKRLCKCPEGRLAFAEHALAVPAVARTMLRVSALATRLAVSVLWLAACAVAPPAERVLDDLVMSGGVGKLLALLQVESSASTKEKAAKLLRVHGAFWRQYPCFPTDLRDYLKFLN